ncbi:acyl-CoA dehydrogenase family protein [Embleya sp. NPDC059259]|uniref:acyl-CoA dehydrogenase family protein n=1 Tax=unclassified Embleya TaxID=2699296 RepID=UPI00369D350A
MRWIPGSRTALATAAGVAGEPLVAAVIAAAVDVIGPAAERTAAVGVPRSHLEELARAGACGLLDYEPIGAGGVTGAQVVREVHEVLSAVDPATWFVFAQHFALVKGLVASGNVELREQWLPALVKGERFATAGFAYLRHPTPPVVAEGVGDGWRLRGRIPWMTGWGLADVAFVGAVTSDDRALFVVLDCAAADGLVADEGQALWAMQATHTAAVELRDVFVPASDVIALGPRSRWIREYDDENANAHPAVFGHLRAACDLLVRSGPRAGTEYEDLGLRIAEEAARLRAEAYSLRDRLPDGEGLAARIAVRAATLDLCARAGTACVVATGGRAMSHGDPAGRLAREAQFHLIQAQTPQLRAEMGRLMLRRL